MNKNLAQIKAYIRGRGFACEDTLVENYYLSLLTRPFVILAGMSNTDLTKLPELFAAALGATRENGRYRCMEVEYDWMDTSDLFGRLNLEGKFIPGAIIDFLKQAYENPDKPYFLCFDKLILSRAEYYLREILGIIETAEAGQTPGALVPAIYYGRDQEALDTYGVIPKLDNLYIVGTLNLDQTSFPLNQKFMDRLHCLQIYPESITVNGVREEIPATELGNDFLRTPILRLEQCGEYQQKVMEFIAIFEEVNRILMTANAYVGFKIRNDGVVYLVNNYRTEALEQGDAVDHILTQKVLVRAQGNGKTVEPVLEKLLDYCRGRYPGAERKLNFMLEKCRTEGYTAYWI